MNFKRSTVSKAVRIGINRVLERDDLPEETDGWAKRLTPNRPPQPDGVKRLTCGRPIREELRQIGVPAEKTRKMRSKKLANPGEDPGTIKNVVDFCWTIVGQEDGD